MSKAVSSKPNCGYVDRRDKIDHHLGQGKAYKGSNPPDASLACFEIPCQKYDERVGSNGVGKLG
jgi:hypothetical protein